MTNADARRDNALGYEEPVVAHLQRGTGREQIDSVVLRPRDVECCAQPTGTTGELTRFRRCPYPAIEGHFSKAGNRLKCTEQHTPGLALRFAGYVHTEILTVDRVDIRVARRAKKDGISWRGSAMRVGRGVRRIVVRTEVGFDFDDTTGEGLRPFCLSNKYFAQKERRNLLGRVLEEGAGKKFSAHD